MKTKQRKSVGLKEVTCKTCKRTKMTIDDSSVSGVCWKCVAMMCDPPKQIKPKSTKPRGWAFMNEYVDKDGKVYFKGIEQPKLFGKKEPTVIKKKEPKITNKLNKKQKERIKSAAAAEIFDIRKQIELLDKKPGNKGRIKKLHILMKKYHKVTQGKMNNLNELNLRTY